MDQLDERDKQAFLELQEKLVEQTNKKKQVELPVKCTSCVRTPHRSATSFYR